ncbi:GGDEF domain-containing protein [Candidatus Pacearchaeota archaeon]|nr:MAG: GGDEF domain-containing protein [Candidatus Pacearchaeota archaeon]
MKFLDPDFKSRVSQILKDLKDSLYALYEAATRDEKTKTYNMKFFSNIFEMELEKAKRGKQKLSLLILDIDFFKKLNDKYGHLIGDSVLIELAKTLQSNLRKYDILARFGGEEFVILLPETSGKRAVKVAERLRKSLHKNPTLKKFNITISIGATEYKQKDSQKRMFSRADKALYSSKKNGRNQTTLA